jgi:hypothetical protein
LNKGTADTTKNSAICCSNFTHLSEAILLLVEPVSLKFSLPYLSTQKMAPQTKRTLEEGESLLEGVKALVLDIEGTITPISFVKVNKFYAKRLASFTHVISFRVGDPL